MDTSDPLRNAVHALVSKRVREVREDSEPIRVVLDWKNGREGPAMFPTEVDLASTPSGSLSARREMLVSALTDLCMDAVDLHDCCDRVVHQVHSL